MTTYSGKSARYDPGRVNPNKEPSTSLDVIEKMYKQHREKMLDIQPLVDDKIVIPSFIKKQSWKKLQLKHHDDEIANINEAIYKRLVKVESRESAIATDARTHIKRVNQQLKYWKSVNDHDRRRQQEKIQRENESFMQRIEKTRPEYTLKSCQDWYKHHERFKKGRKHDPTAGHLMKGMKGLLPKPLPPIDRSRIGSENSSFAPSTAISFDNRSNMSSQFNGSTTLRISKSRAGLSSRESLNSPSLLSAIIEPLPSGIAGGSSVYSATRRTGASPNKGKAHIGRAGLPNKAIGSLHQKSSLNSNFGIIVNESNVEEEYEDEDDIYGNPNFGESIVPFQSNFTDDNASITSKGSEHGSFYNSPKKLARPRSDGNLANMSTNSLKALEKQQGNAEDKIVLFARPEVNNPEAKNCIVQICTRKELMDELTIRVISSGNTSKILAERPVSVEKAYDIVNESAANTSMINQVTNHEDVQALRTLLVNMFREADVQKSGEIIIVNRSKII
jgi:hypothetical protein